MARWLRLLQNIPLLAKENSPASIRRALDRRGVADAPGVKPLQKKKKDSKGQGAANLAWESVLLARNVHRPTAQYYINSMVDGFLEPMVIELLLMMVQFFAELVDCGSACYGFG